MADTQQLQKAYLEIETGTKIDCMFNPAKFSFSQGNRWESDQIPGKPTPSMRYTGGTEKIAKTFRTKAAAQAWEREMLQAGGRAATRPQVFGGPRRRDLEESGSH